VGKTPKLCEVFDYASSITVQNGMLLTSKIWAYKLRIKTFDHDLDTLSSKTK